MAFSMSPPASMRAARQSLNPALVRSRNSFTSWAGICTAGCCVLILLSYLDLVKVVLRSMHFLQNGPPPNLPGRATGISHPRSLPAAGSSLAYLFVRRHCSFRAFRRRFGRALHEVAFLLFVLFVRAGVHVFDTFDQ